MRAARIFVVAQADADCSCQGIRRRVVAGRGEHNADQFQIDSLFTTLVRLTPVAVLTDAGKKTSMERLKVNHTQVEIRGKDGIIKRFKVGPTNKTRPLYSDFLASFDGVAFPPSVSAVAIVDRDTPSSAIKTEPNRPVV